MKIVIDIPEKLYEECKRIGDSRDTLFEAIRNSTPLTELIDDIKADIDELSRIHADGEFYVTNFDVKRIVYKHISEVGTSKSLPEGSKE